MSYMYIHFKLKMLQQIAVGVNTNILMFLRMQHLNVSKNKI